MSDRCVLVADHHIGAYRVGWYFDDGEIGAVLGDDPAHSERQPPTEYSVAAEHHIATYAVFCAMRSVDCDTFGFKFDTMAQAKKALSIAKRAIVDAKANRAPEPWEALALAAGWTPPKGKR
jgi:hypothetical protein